MIEMSGADAYFLREESRARHMHTLKIVVVEPEGAYDPPSIERVRAGAVGVLPREPAFRRRVLDVPAGFGNPFWVDAHELDPHYHVRHEILPPGSTDAALDELAGRIASEPLDRERPLWQIIFVEGLPNGRVAYVTKIHHAVADGVASAELALRTLQENREQMLYEPWCPPPALPLPSRRDRIWAATKKHARRQRELPGLVWRSMREVGTSLSWRRSGRRMPAQMFNAPAARFNQPITPNRVYAHVRLPLPRIIEVKRAANCTVNDVFLTLVGGAVHRYLAAQGERNSSSLTAAIPISVRNNLEDPAFGNAVTAMLATTASHVADPLERMRIVAKSTAAARALFERRDARLAVEWYDHWVLRRLWLHDSAGSQLHRLELPRRVLGRCARLPRARARRTFVGRRHGGRTRDAPKRSAPDLNSRRHCSGSLRLRCQTAAASRSKARITEWTRVKSRSSRSRSYGSAQTSAGSSMP